MQWKFIPTEHFRSIWVRLRYPKFMLLVFTFVFAYLLFAHQELAIIRTYFLHLGYFGAFLTGIFYAYGFTAAPATGILLVMAKELNIFFAGFLAGIGALLADYIIFRFVRYSFDDEIERLSQEPITLWVTDKVPSFIKKYFAPIIGCIIIASPLPDELGVTMLAISTISTRLFLVASYVLNTLGIFAVLFIGTML